MSEEKAMILRMLEEGKISSEEANELLRAIDDNRSVDQDKDEAKIQSDDIGDRIENVVQDTVEGIRVLWKSFFQLLTLKV